MLWIGCVGLGPEMGGVASVARSSIRALASDYRLHVISYEDRHRPDWLEPSISFRGCGGSRLKFIVQLAKQIVLRPTRLLFDHVDLAQTQMLFPRALRRPYCIWGHGIELWRELPPRKKGALEQASLILFNSNFTREKAAGWHQIGDSCVVHLAEELAEKTADHAPSSTDRRLQILTVGRLVEDRPKGHLEILEAMPEVVGKFPDLEWHVVGNGPWKDDFQSRVESCEVAKNVVIHGFVSDEELKKLYLDSRLFVMPSHGEGFGLVYVEAMRSGCICIVSDLDAGQEVIGDAGVVVPGSQPGELARVMIEYLGDEAACQEVQQRGLRRVQDFLPQAFASRLTEAMSREVAKGI